MLLLLFIKILLLIKKKPFLKLLLKRNRENISFFLIAKIEKRTLLMCQKHFITCIHIQIGTLSFYLLKLSYFFIYKII